MTTANVVVSYTPTTGRSSVTLTSWAGTANFTTTPISGDQIEYPNAISVSESGAMSGAQGTYTVRHIIASTGAIEAINVSLVGNKIANQDVDFEPSSGQSRVTLTEWSGSLPFTNTPIAGDQIIYNSTISISSSGIVSGPNGTYTILHARASTGFIEAVSYVISGANTAPSFPVIGEQIVNVGDTANIDITATDPDGNTNLTYTSDVVPTGINAVSGPTITGTYGSEETVLTTLTVQDDSGDTGNDTDTTQVLFSVARAGYTITTSTVDYLGLNPDSPFIEGITDGDLEVGDQFDYPSSQSGRTIWISSDGVVTVSGTRSIAIDGVYIRDKSASYSRVGPIDITIVGTGPVLTSALAVVADSENTSGGQVTFTSDESGDYRVIVISQNAGVPTRSQVFSGLAPDGGSPLFDSGIQAQVATVAETITVTGLPTEGAGYHVYAALEDQYGGLTLAGPVTLATTTVGSRPTWSSIPGINLNRDEYFTQDFSVYATGALTYSLSGLPDGSGLSFNTTTGVLSGTPTDNDVPGGPGTTSNYILAITGYNATGNTTTSFSAAIYYPQSPVIAGSIQDDVWREGIEVDFNISAKNVFTNATSYELQVLVTGSYTSAAPVLANYGLSYNSSTGSITGVPNSLMTLSSPYAFRVRAANSDGLSTWVSFNVTVNAKTAAGFFGPIPTQQFIQGVEITPVNFSSFFTNSLSYTASGFPAGSGLSFDNTTGILSGTPLNIDLSSSPYDLVITGINPNGNAIGTAPISVTTLIPVIISAFPDLSYTTGDTITLTLRDNFSSEDFVSVSDLPDGTGLTFDGTSLTGTLNNSDKLASPFLVRVTATNANGSVSDTFLLTVTGSALDAGVITTPDVRMVSIKESRPLSFKTYYQDIVDRIDYGFDLSTWLGSDTISNVSITEGDVVADGGKFDTTSLCVFINGGILGESQKVTTHVTTVGGRELDLSFYVAFVDM